MARAALGLGIRELAAISKVGAATISRFEAGDELMPRTIGTIRAALEAAGVDFIEENGGGPGVRIKLRGGIDIVEGPDGTWGVTAVWREGAPADLVSTKAARDYAVDAQGRGNIAWAERIIAAAARADMRNNKLNENGTQKGWTTDPNDADETPV